MTRELIQDNTTGKLVRDSVTGRLQRKVGEGAIECIYCDPGATPSQIALTITGLSDCANCHLIEGSYYKVFGLAAAVNNVTFILDHMPIFGYTCRWYVDFDDFFGVLSKYTDSDCTVRVADYGLHILGLSVHKVSMTEIYIYVSAASKDSSAPQWVKPFMEGLWAFYYNGTPTITDCIAVSGLSNQLNCFLLTPEYPGCGSGQATIVQGAASQSWWQTRLPASDASVQWLPTSNNYTQVDDPPGAPDDDISYTYTNNGTYKDFFNFPSFSIPAGSTITSVEVTGVFKRIDAGGSYLARLLLRVNGVTYNGPSEQFLVGGYFTRTATWTTNPNTGGAWTVADVNGIGSHPLQNFGYECMGFQKTVRCTQVYVKVSYTKVW